MTKTQMVTTLFQAFGKDNETDRKDVYVVMLNDVPAEILQKVIFDCINTEQFLPTIAVIKQKALSLGYTITGEQGDKDWDEVWEEVLDNMRRVGPYRKPSWSSEELRRAVASVGWVHLCEISDRELPIVKAQMRDAYKAICGRKKEKEHNINLLNNVSEFKSLKGKLQEKSLGDYVKQIENRN